MRLLAISDLHLSHAKNREALARMTASSEDWLILAGDVGEKPEHLVFALDHLTPRFARVVWVPGNHDLWCPPDATDRTRGQARYDELVAICRAYGVLTPEDPYEVFPTAGLQALPNERRTADRGPVYVCPLFCLYDYTFHPRGITDPVAWARESGVVCGDEWMLSPHPWPSRAAWCHARCDWTEQQLAALPAEASTVLISHWPLRYDLARPPRVPRFSVWCGTTRTEDWPQRFRARAVVSGHLHMRTTLVRHGVRHEEVSLGYPRDWNHEHDVRWYLREILPDDGSTSRFIPARDPFMIPYS